jgi:hypothetical protein
MGRGLDGNLQQRIRTKLITRSNKREITCDIGCCWFGNEIGKTE